MAGLLAGPAILRGELVGSPRAETYGHAWVQACAAAQWPAWPGGTDLAVGTALRPVIDPLPTWIAGGFAQMVGLTGAWNGLVVGWIVLAAVGAAALGRATSLSPTWVAVAAVLSPIWRGSVWSGLTEDGAIGLGMLAIALLWSGSGDRGSLRRAALGGALLGLLAWCGLYLAWLAAAAAVGVTIWRVLRPGRGRAIGRLAAGGVLALVIALPALLPFKARLAGVGHRFGTAPALQEPLWRVNPWRASDLASFGVPTQRGPTGVVTGEVALGDAFVREHPTWVGYPLLALAAVGTGPLTVPAAVLAAWSVGPNPSWEGTPTGFENPVAVLLDGLPYASSFNHHARLWLLGEVCVVLLAGVGIRRIGDRLPGVRLVLVPVAITLVLADAALLAPGPLILPGTSAATPSIYAALSALPPGPITVLGANGPGIHPQKLYFDQRAHGRKVLSNPDRPEPPDLSRVKAGMIVVALGGPASAPVMQARSHFGEPQVADSSGGVWLLE